MIKNITGADFKAFYQDDDIWKVDGRDAYFCEDLFISIKGEEGLDMDAIYEKYGDGFEKLPDNASLTLETGYRFLNYGFQSPGADPEDDLLVLFRDWQERRNQITFVATVSVDKNDTQALARVEKALEELKDLGVTISRSDDASPQRKASPKP